MKTKVLVPVDRGHNSLTAEEYALRLNWIMPMSVTLLNVINTKRLAGHGISPDDQRRILTSMRARAEEVLANAAAPFDKAGVEHQTRIESGAPAEVICRVAGEEGFAMVIIAQSEVNQLEEILGGSVVRTVLNRCQIPVLLVKHTPAQVDRQRRRRSKDR